MTSIKQNEVLGRKIERMLADEIEFNTGEKPSFTDLHVGYDFGTPSVLYEVKSCHSRIKNGQYKNKQKSRDGRFFILEETHKSLKTLADKFNKRAWYIFVLLNENDKIIKKKWIDWFGLQIILQRCKQRKNGDYMINNKFVFGDRNVVSTKI